MSSQSTFRQTSNVTSRQGASNVANYESEAIH